MNAPRTKRRGVIEPTVFAVVGVTILIGLGIWQLDRKTWKQNLIMTLTTRLARAPEDLPPRASWPRLIQEGNEFRRVTFPAEFLDGQEALVYTAGSPLRPDVKGPGYWVFAPAQLSGGSIVLINRGFVPLERKDPATRADGKPHGIVEVAGLMRWPETRACSRPPTIRKPMSGTRDSKGIAEAKKWASVAPFYIDQESPVPPGGTAAWQARCAAADNHPQYAITRFASRWPSRRLCGVARRASAGA